MSAENACLCSHSGYDHGRLVESGALVDWACALCQCPSFRPATPQPERTA